MIISAHWLLVLTILDYRLSSNFRVTVSCMMLAAACLDTLLGGSTAKAHSASCHRAVSKTDMNNRNWPRSRSGVAMELVAQFVG